MAKKSKVRECSILKGVSEVIGSIHYEYVMDGTSILPGLVFLHESAVCVKTAHTATAKQLTNMIARNTLGMTDADYCYLIANGFTFYDIITEGTTPERYMATSSSGISPSGLSRITVDKFINLFHYNYSASSIYRGQHSYHSQPRTGNRPKTESAKPYLFGVELEVEFSSSEGRRDFARESSNVFLKETDGSLGSYGCEIVTIPLRGEEAKSPQFWEPLCNRLKNSAKSWSHSTCGLHVHLSRSILGSDREQENLGKLLFFYNHYLEQDEMNVKIFGRSRTYSYSEGKTSTGEAVKTLGTAVLRDDEVKKRVKTECLRRNSSGRYFDVNIQPEKTIEFRKGKGSINPIRIAAICIYVELICQFVCETEWHKLTYERFQSYLLANCRGDSPLRAYLTSAMDA